MIDLCEHKFKDIDARVEHRISLHRILEGDLLDWDTYMVLKTPTPAVFIGLYQEVSGFKFNCRANGSSILIRAVKKDILEFIELVEEEYSDFEYEISEVSPLLVFDPDCPECNAELDIGCVISIEI